MKDTKKLKNTNIFCPKTIEYHKSAKMALEPSFESMSFNPFFTNDSLNDSNQNSDVTFYNDIFSFKTNYLSPSDIDKNFQNFSKESFSVLHLNNRSMNNFEAFQNMIKS